MNVDDIAPSELRAVLRDLMARTENAERRASEAELRAGEEQAKSRDLAAQLATEKHLSAQLMAQLQQVTRRLAQVTSRPEQLALELELRQLQQRLDAANHELFGSKSEHRGRPDGASPKSKGARKVPRGHGPKAQPELPRIEQLHVLPSTEGQDEAACPCCQAPLQSWDGQTSDAEEVDVIERAYVIRLHKRQKYKCRGCGHMDTAPGPKRLIPGGRYSPEFAASVAVDKFRGHLPTTRQVKRMAEVGLDVSSQTLWDQLHQLYILLLPTWLALRERILAEELIHIDESTWRVMRREGSKKWWVWAMTCGRRVYFELHPTRGQEAARAMLGSYDGVVMADRYAVYESLERELTRRGGQPVLLPFNGGEVRPIPSPDYDLTSCWAHCRRGFIRAQRAGELGTSEALDLIGELYAIEELAKNEVAKVEDRDAREEALVWARNRLREERSLAVAARLKAWATAFEPLPGGALEKAIAWMNNGWPRLHRVLEDGRAPLDNTLAERVIRGVVLGRKVHYGSRSEDGTRVSALLYSLVGSCKLEGVDARGYLIEATRRALKDRRSVFLPEDYAAELARGGAVSA